MFICKEKKFLFEEEPRENILLLLPCSKHVSEISHLLSAQILIIFLFFLLRLLLMLVCIISSALGFNVTSSIKFKTNEKQRLLDRLFVFFSSHKFYFQIHLLFDNFTVIKVKFCWYPFWYMVLIVSHQIQSDSYKSVFKMFQLFLRVI